MFSSHVRFIAVLITCHNRKDKTLSCLECLHKQIKIGEFFNIVVFLVDDASSDGTKDAISNQYPDVNIIQGNGKLYWNRGMHLAWKAAVEFNRNFDYYLWLNDDTYLYPNAISNLITDALSCGNNSLICGSTYSEINKTTSYGGYTNKGNLLFPNNTLREAYTINGNCVLIPKFVFEKVGILDKRFPHAIGDFEYGLRVRKQNLNSFVSKEYVGVCEGFTKLPLWCSPNISLLSRLKNLYSPLGNSHPFYYFIFENSYYGFLRAFKHFLSIHLRLLFPDLWLKKNK